MDSYAVRESVKESVSESVRRCLRSGAAEPLEEATPLLVDGTLDSLGMVELLTELGDRFRIEFEEHDLTPENFFTVGDVMRLVERKCAAA